MDALIRGLQAFLNNVVGPNREFFSSLAAGQHPSTLFITCSDSRIDPNLLTQTNPGDLFVLRNAGCMVPPHGQPSGESATIEYAVGVLQVKDIVVCGHSHCGAMSALAHRTSLQELPEVRHWLQHAAATLKIVDAKYPATKGVERVNAAIAENVLVQLDHLRGHPVVAQAVERGALRLHGWIYAIETGQVLAYDEEAKKYAPLVKDAGKGDTAKKVESKVTMGRLHRT